MTLYLFVASIFLLSMSQSVFQTFADAAAPLARVNACNDVFASGGHASGADAAAIEMNRAADFFPRHVVETVTTTVTVTECGSTPAVTVIPPIPGTIVVESPPPSGTPPITGTTPVESAPPASITPPVPGTTAVESSPPAEEPPVSSTNPPGTPESSEATPPGSSAPPASEATPPPPDTGIPPITTAPPPVSSVPGESTIMTSSDASSFPPSSAQSTSPGTITPPAATSSLPPPAPNTGAQVSYNKAAVMVGVILAAIAVI